jgi:hypothetical protein
MKKLWSDIKKKVNLIVVVFCVIMLFISLSLLITRLVYDKPIGILLIPEESKVTSMQQIVIQSFSDELTGTLEILWDNANVITSPISLVSEVPFTLTLYVDVKLVQNDKIIHWYGIPTYQVMNQFDNKYAMPEPGTGLFKAIGYSAPLTKGVLVGNVEEWIRPHWYVITQTSPVYIESTNEVFTSSLVSPIWNWLDLNDNQVAPDNEGFFYNRIITLDWSYRVYLPVIMKSVN